MEYIYHGVPPNFSGEMLYPLFSLKEKHPEIFAREIKKYDDHPKRKLLPNLILKKLNCPRGDVLQFSPIHPNLIFQGLKSVFPDGNRSVKFFEIPIERTHGIPTILFDMNRPGYVFGEDEPEEIFDWVTPANYRMIRQLPLEAIEFYQEWKTRGEPGAPAYGKIPHIMVKGPVSVKDCKIVDWRDSI